VAEAPAVGTAAGVAVETTVGTTIGTGVEMAVGEGLGAAGCWLQPSRKREAKNSRAINFFMLFLLWPFF